MVVASKNSIAYVFCTHAAYWMRPHLDPRSFLLWGRFWDVHRISMIEPCGITARVKFQITNY